MTTFPTNDSWPKALVTKRGSTWLFWEEYRLKAGFTQHMLTIHLWNVWRLTRYCGHKIMSRSLWPGVSKLDSRHLRYICTLILQKYPSAGDLENESSDWLRKCWNLRSSKVCVSGNLYPQHVSRRRISVRCQRSWIRKTPRLTSIWHFYSQKSKWLWLIQMEVAVYDTCNPFRFL